MIVRIDGLDRWTVRMVGAHLVGFGGHDPAMQLFDAPSFLHPFVCQPIQWQAGWVEFFDPLAPVVVSVNAAEILAKMMLPDAVDQRPSHQWIVRVCHPSSQCQTPPSDGCIDEMGLVSCTMNDENPSAEHAWLDDLLPNSDRSPTKCDGV